MTFGGVLLTEFLGAAWLAATTSLGFVPALASVLIYIPGDLLKMALSVLVVQQLTAVIPALR
jgi:biotin transport system substrate-specific component